MSKLNYFPQTLAGWELEVRRDYVHIGTIREGSQGIRAYEYFKGPQNQATATLHAETLDELKKRVEASSN